MKISLSFRFRINVLSLVKYFYSIIMEEQLITACSRRMADCVNKHSTVDTWKINAGATHENHHSTTSLTSSPSIKCRLHASMESPSYNGSLIGE